MDEETKRNERERDRLLLIKLNKFLPLVNLEVFLVHALPLVLSGTSRGKLGSLGRPPLSSSTYIVVFLEPLLGLKFQLWQPFKID